MHRILYSALLYLLSPLIVLYLAFRALKSADYRGRWGERFGCHRLEKTDLLVHSVSMGETLAAIPLIRRIQAAYPGLHITVTTTSPTGSAEVLKAFGDAVQHCYLPLDFPMSVRRFLTQLQPKHCIIMETELWPNLLHHAAKAGVKLMLANGRLSAKSARRYQSWPGLNCPMLQTLDLLAVQTRAEAERFEALGVAAGKLHVCGSVKFDIQIPEEQRARALAWRQSWGRQTAPVWVAGSVHPGEFEAVLSAHKHLLSVWPEALLILVPRHPEQFEAAAEKIRQMGLELTRRSRQQMTAGTQVLLGDTMGELLSLYGAADQAFVGGTLIANGGHNPLEPAAMGLAVLMGPNHWDFAEITCLLHAAGALRLVDSGEELGQALQAYFAEPGALKQASRAAMEVVSHNRGALDKQFALVAALIG
ncbi:lipid IV(A) 3-deoxy-D-manno-octulosonic acid transferase [Shewanella salipaludis]|uniref:3-deoxy-D-manno-octulosonic acid transferase n=1 Tax=Shewanella salipaludis TaxID=2723052 RepID=A0A972JK12_9GAMM|nr:lipid IV(A) 3-deoxy-D-manno-octulosonic acid transferase [Shewanella salipaludis]NMH66698.1 3-deoxy-D-manno-octulosonic acid transferase [Shewanella salipaludis]